MAYDSCANLIEAVLINVDGFVNDNLDLIEGQRAKSVFLQSQLPNAFQPLPYIEGFGLDDQFPGRIEPMRSGSVVVKFDPIAVGIPKID